MMSSNFFFSLTTKDFCSHFDSCLAQCKEGISPVLIILLIFFEEVLNKGAISKNLGWKIYMLISIWVFWADQEGKK